MIMIDPIKLGYPTSIRPVQDIPGKKGHPRVPANVKTIFIVRQTWDGRPHLVGDQDVVIDNPQETPVVGNFHLRRKNRTEEERRLLMAVREEFKEKKRRNLRKGELHNCLDDSLVIRELAFSSVNHPCTAPPPPPPAPPPPPPPHCSGPLSGDWVVLTTTASSDMCTNVDCDKITDTDVCRCETTNTEGPIIIGSGIAIQVGVCHEGNTLSGEWHPHPQETVTLHGTVEPRGSPGILDDHVSFAHELRIDLGCGQNIIAVVGDGTVTDDSGLFGAPNVEGNWRRTSKFFLSCIVCPPPGNLRSDCVSSGTFKTLIFRPATGQSNNRDLDIGAWEKGLAQRYKSLRGKFQR
ncbi:MAG: hypothetical protein ACREGD_05075 [Candidatus Saccharimonadales bacterium]